uniref:NAD-dependent protein deacylase n=1 Tax=uncultured bacterium UPO57 TaxID=1776980 RepID=A0A126T0E4_9BACT|nr:NAD-dependent protein deacetylases, SIR2 family [uncultured bacterium UPO57]
MKRILVLTGSGVSAESGLSTFRDKDGVWAKYDYREVATPEGFAANPALVHGFYNERRRGLKHAAPNAAHFALSELEERLAARGGALLIVTQNVDDLHERAGSKALVHMHGELAKARCGLCGAVEAWTEDLSVETACPACGASGGMRPDVVWFGETPKHMDVIAAALAEADLFVSIGTSGAVYPAAGFVAEARALGIPCTELNLEPSENAFAFDERRYGKASEIVPAWARGVLA